MWLWIIFTILKNAFLKKNATFCRDSSSDCLPCAQCNAFHQEGRRWAGVWGGFCALPPEPPRSKSPAGDCVGGRGRGWGRGGVALAPQPRTGGVAGGGRVRPPRVGQGIAGRGFGGDQICPACPLPNFVAVVQKTVQRCSVKQKVSRLFAETRTANCFLYTPTTAITSARVGARPNRPAGR